jgi:Arc/MetJ family transcription regulator
MRTTIDLPEALLDEVQRTTKATTRRDALVIALEDYLRRQRRSRVIGAAGTMDVDLDVRTLRDLGNGRRDD